MNTYYCRTENSMQIKHSKAAAVFFHAYNDSAKTAHCFMLIFSWCQHNHYL